MRAHSLTTPLPVPPFSTLPSIASSSTSYYHSETADDGALPYYALQAIDGYTGAYDQRAYCPCTACTASPARHINGIPMEAMVVPQQELPPASATMLPVRRSQYSKLPPMLPGVPALPAHSARPRHLPVASLPPVCQAIDKEEHTPSSPGMARPAITGSSIAVAYRCQ
ncbi:hypothetical protein SYNPS1DRAFT_27424 [Syncephalis pseudoplumigaleata]|uniref:Uncharacterized protein n=1 Tax=Syncephalis pseudoplumigaleata TaxID=1712513 RepID=A0A4P9Z2X9_9FUNG|nr:hypothetical protein SYNPS1DRAFT_27424 [Syncephalis pseudoplumigaleata]|eukprot:RKP26893.1 hypothetical protein SYNPS1DRAFT_27424 [Syncephalis pseudoplumigaleata]